MTRLSLVALLTLSTLAFSQQPEGDSSQSYPCPLQGLKDGRLTLTSSATVELFDGKKRVASADLPGHDFNPAKGEVKCEGTTISISSQMPFKATVQTTELTWMKGVLKAGATQTEDPSREALGEAETQLKAGNIEAAIEQLGNVLYPQQYYNEYDMAARILQRAHEVANKRYKERDKAGAAKVMEQAFEHFSAYSELPEGGATVPAARLTAIRNDYGFFLAEAGRFADAEKELREVVKAAPERAVARLNLADALWTQGKKAEAETQYGEYAKRIPRKKWPATLLERCPNCASIR